MARYKQTSIILEFINGAVVTYSDEQSAYRSLYMGPRLARRIKIGKRPAVAFDPKMIDVKQIQLWTLWYNHHCAGQMHAEKIHALAIRRTLLGDPAPQLGFAVTKKEIALKRELMELKQAHAGLATENDHLRTENKQIAKLLAEAVQIHVKAWMLERKPENVAFEQPTFATLWYPRPDDMPNVADILGTLHYFGTSGKDAVRDVWDRQNRSDPDVKMLYIAELVGDKLTLWWQGNYDALRYRISTFTR